ncbi:8-oxo-dGTP diphosphatase [Arthrobacter sp. UYEF20]|uniref:8-oxo-dGTP diphosphatase n=1 Tax=Arthrobacter sp. UYEF20 TaxID=1756363 RepID=UPI0033970D58
MTSAPVTLCFLLRDTPDGGTEVLLGLKKTGFGKGKIVGLGGHVEPGESDAEAACREVDEEAGVTVRLADLSDAGVVEFRFPARPEWDMSTRLFITRSWQGEPSESAEIAPEWFDTASLPVDRMWQDADHWLPAALAGEMLDIVVVLNDDNETVASVGTYDGGPATSSR